MEKQNQSTGKWEKVRRHEEAQAASSGSSRTWSREVTAVLKEIPGQATHRLDDGREATGKTGTWEHSRTAAENAHAWMVGYTPQLATAVWVGNTGTEKPLISDKDGKRDQRCATCPATIWKRFMNAGAQGQGEARLPAGIADIGDPTRRQRREPRAPAAAGSAGRAELRPADRPVLPATGRQPTAGGPSDPDPAAAGGGGLLPSTPPITYRD